jgi:nitrile hydratase accessory protein
MERLKAPWMPLGAFSFFRTYDWEDFRQQLIAVIGEWERTHDLGDASWNYYECWLTALERVVVDKALVGPKEVDQVVAQLPAEEATSLTDRGITNDRRQEF